MKAWLLLLALQAHAHPAPPAPVSTDVILEIAKRPTAIRQNIGSAHDPVGTASKQAQAFYDQGLAYLHSYWWLEAARSFNQALTLDPNLAMAHAALSLAYTELNAPAAARNALARATALAPKASAHDRAHIDVRAKQMAAELAAGDPQRLPARLAEWRGAVIDAVAKFPDDEELVLMRGLAESPDPAERGQGSTMASAPFYEKALALAPGHFAGHHYLTHACENGGRVDRALAEGGTYAKMAPAVPHARHMFGHNLRRAGRIDEAIAEFTAADDLETGYFKTERVPAAADWHYQHNVDLLATSYQYVGQMKKAEALMRRSFAMPSALVQQEVNKREWPVFLLSRGRTREALDAATEMAGHRSPIVSAAGHIMIAHAKLVAGDYKAAADEGNVAVRLMRSAPYGAGIVAAALEQMQGEFFLRTGQRDKGKSTLEALAAKVRAAPGPDAWIQALFTLEAIARAAREAGDWGLAAWAAQQMMEHDPNYAGSHYAVALAARQQGDRRTADRELERARALWKQADPDLAELKAIQAQGGD